MFDNCTSNSTNANYPNCTNNSTNPPPKEGEAPPQIHILALNIIMAMACTLCNGIIVAVFIVEKSIRNQANMFIISLACADLVVGMVAIPLYVVNAAPDLQIPYNHITSVDILCYSASIFNCALLSAERALKITFPYWYANSVTTFRIKLVILLGWILAIVVGSLSWTRENPNNITYVVSLFILIYILPVLIIIVSYTSIFLVANKHAKSIRRQNSGIAGEQARIRISEARTACHLGIFIIVFVICWTPLFVKIWWKILHKRGELKSVLPLAFQIVAIILPQVNAIINPFLYALFNPAFRKGMAKLYKRKKQSSNYMESIRRKETSTIQTNVTNSPSVSRMVSSHCSPSMERHEPSLTLADMGRVHLLTCKKMSTLPQAQHELANDQNDNDHYHFFETSL